MKSKKNGKKTGTADMRQRIEAGMATAVETARDGLVVLLLAPSGEVTSDVAAETAAPATPATWRDPHGDPPEDDSDVLVRQLDPEEPTVIGRLTSDGWWMCEGVTGLRPLLREGVRGWLHLHEAAAIIDAAKPRAEFGSILAGLVARGTITQEDADRAEGRLDDRS